MDAHGASHAPEISNPSVPCFRLHRFLICKTCATHFKKGVKVGLSSYTALIGFRLLTPGVVSFLALRQRNALTEHPAKRLLIYWLIQATRTAHDAGNLAHVSRPGKDATHLVSDRTHLEQPSADPTSLGCSCTVPAHVPNWAKAAVTS